MPAPLMPLTPWSVAETMYARGGLYDSVGMRMPRPDAHDATDVLPGDPRADIIEERVEEASIRTMDRTVELVSNLPHVACRGREVVEGALDAPVLRRSQAQGSVPLGISGRREAERC